VSDHDDHDDDHDEAIYPDPFVTALELCRITSSPKTMATALKKLRKLGRDIDAAEQKLSRLQSEAAGIVDAAQAEVKAIHEAAAQRLEAAATAEDELVLREQKIARLEPAWRGLGEPQDVLSGLRSPEFSPLQKARMAHGQSPGKDPDRLFFSEPDAVPAAQIDALIRRDVGDERSDAQGNAFAPSTLTRSTEHKRGAA
jgi:hypothetical protein